MEIKCPHCGQMFNLSEDEGAKIREMIKTKEFEKELDKRLKELMQKADLEKENEIEKLRYSLNEENTKAINELKDDFRLKEDKVRKEHEKEVSDLKGSLEKANSNITDVKNKLDLKDRENELALKEQEQELRSEFDKTKQEYDLTISMKDQEIAKYKEFKARSSTKMIGESLEQHCLTEFNKIRQTAFRGVYFEKDNEIVDGTKADFIYRENDETGSEMLSICFEMKNEMDADASVSETKHKNEDFFKKLDADRKKKGCEYAVLVSMLEEDNDYYNQGIVEVYQYEKMYVIRPQFFLPIISLLRNLARTTVEYKREIVIANEKNIDIKNFEDQWNAFASDFSKTAKNVGTNFNRAIDEIDATIKKLEGIKENLRLTIKHFNTANNKVEGMTIKKLAKNSPTLLTELK